MAREHARRSPHRRQVGGPLPLRVSYGELPQLAGRVAVLLRRGHRIVLDVAPPGRADLRLVAALARLALVARRSAGLLHVRTGGELQELLRLTGLERAVAGPAPSVQVRRQAVLHEDLRSEEVVDVRDAPG